MACPKSRSTFWAFGTGNTPSIPEHVRPASRDVSNDARSGNANRHVLPSEPAKRLKSESKTVIRQHVPARVLIRVNGTSSRHNLLFTMLSRTGIVKDDANFCFSRMNSVFALTRRTALRAGAARARRKSGDGHLALRSQRLRTQHPTSAQPGAKRRKRDRASPIVWRPVRRPAPKARSGREDQ